MQSVPRHVDIARGPSKRGSAPPARRRLKVLHESQIALHLLAMDKRHIAIVVRSCLYLGTHPERHENSSRAEIVGPFSTGQGGA